MQSLIVIHPFQLPAGWNLTRPNNTCNNIFKARLRILILSKTSPAGDNYVTNSRHERLFGRWSSFAEKQQRVCPYF
jgi:hypothetical protein